MLLSVLFTALLASSALAAKTVTVTKTVTRRGRPTTTVTRTSRTVSTILTTDTITNTVTDTATNTVTDTATNTVTNTVTDTDTDTTTATVTNTASSTTTITTTTTATPTPTAFDGRGYLYVFPDSGPRKGCLISGGNWYAGGGSCATYRATRIGDRGNFNLTTSRGPCVVQASDNSLNCAAANENASIFGQNDDGELTYAGSDGFFAKATATGTTQQPVYATAAPVGLSIQWFSIS